MHSAELATTAPNLGGHARRFAVSWRNSTSGSIHPVGLLEAGDNLYHFRYLPTAAEISGFRPFIGFPRLDIGYESTRLWPFFALRAMDPRRPDFDVYVARLGLTPAASVLDILARSGGETQGERVSIVEAPVVGLDGSTEYLFLVRGARYATSQFKTDGVFDELRPGDRLRLVPDLSNPVNPDALLITTAVGQSVGWVPDLLVPYFRSLAQHEGTLLVAQNNGLEAPWHVRLLVRAGGVVDPTATPFTGPSWPTTLA